MPRGIANKLSDVGKSGIALILLRFVVVVVVIVLVTVVVDVDVGVVVVVVAVMFVAVAIVVVTPVVLVTLLVVVGSTVAGAEVDVLDVVLSTYTRVVDFTNITFVVQCCDGIENRPHVSTN